MRIILVLLFFFLSYSVHAQYEYLLHKSYVQKADKMHHVFDSILRFNDLEIVSKESQKLRELAIDKNDKSLQFEVDLFELFVTAVFFAKPQSESIKAYKELIQKAEKEGVWHTKLNATRALAEYYWKFLNNYELAFEQYLILDNELQKVNSKDYPQKARDYTQIGESYYYFRDYEQARKYFKKAIAIPETEFNTKIITTAKNNIGLSFQKEEKYDSALFYFQLALKTPFESSLKSWQRIVKGNIGANFYYLNDFSKAIPLLEQDYNGSVKENDIGCLIGSSTLLADIYLKKGDKQKSWMYIEQAYLHALQMKSFDRLKSIYPILSNWYSYNGNSEKSRLYLDSTIYAINEYHNKFNAIKILRAQQEISNQKEKLVQANFELEKQKDLNKLYILLSISILIVIIISGSFVYQKRKRKMVELEKTTIESQLKLAKVEVQQFIKKNNDQNILIDKVTSELENMKELKSDEKVKLEQTLLELRSAIILTDEDWGWFKTHFTTIYPDFLQKIKTKFPDITDAELRYLMLIKLQLSHKEMANMLGISPASVRVTWNRVRKKMGGSLEDTPISLLSQYVS